MRCNWSFCAACMILIAFAARPAPAAPSGGVSPALVAEAEKQFAAVERGVVRLRAAGSAAEADRLSARLRHLRDRFGGAAEADGDGPELHVVGLYQGEYPAGVRPGGDNHPEGSAVVDVGRASRPIVLALCSYEPVRWKLNVAEGTRLRKVILGGYYAQQADNIPAGVPIENAFGDQAGGSRFHAYRKDAENYPRLFQTLKLLTGLPVATFQGVYAFGGAPFVVGPTNADWTAQRVLADLRPDYLAAAASEQAIRREALKFIRFQALYRTPPAGSGPQGAIAPHRITGALAEFTPLGPVTETLRPLPPGFTQVATDPHGPAYYAMSGQRLFRVDLNTGQKTEVAPDPALPQGGWPSGLAFDTCRQRLVIASGAGATRMHAYDPDGKKWSTLQETKGLRLAAFAYAAEEDCFYGLEGAGDDGAPAVICRFDPDGTMTGRVTLSEAIAAPAHAPPGLGVQLAPAGRLVALLTPAYPDPDGPEAPPAARCYLADPRTGQVIYHGIIEPQPATAAAPVSADEWDSLRAALRDGDDAAAEPAVWRLAAGGAKTLERLRVLLPVSAAPDAKRLRDWVAALDGEAASDRDAAASELRQAGSGASEDLRRCLEEDDLSPETHARVQAILRDIAAAPSADAPAADPRWDDDPLLRHDRRLMDVLARMGTPESLKHLRDLAAGRADAPRTRQAKAVLRHLP